MGQFISHSSYLYEHTNKQKIKMLCILILATLSSNCIVSCQASEMYPEISTIVLLLATSGWCHSFRLGVVYSSNNVNLYHRQVKQLFSHLFFVWAKPIEFSQNDPCIFNRTDLSIDWFLLTFSQLFYYKHRFVTSVQYIVYQTTMVSKCWLILIKLFGHSS